MRGRFACQVDVSFRACFKMRWTLTGWTPVDNPWLMGPMFMSSAVVAQHRYVVVKWGRDNSPIFTATNYDSWYKVKNLWHNAATPRNCSREVVYGSYGESIGQLPGEI
jgi:hypothetical protein